MAQMHYGERRSPGSFAKGSVCTCLSYEAAPAQFAKGTVGRAERAMVIPDSPPMPVAHMHAGCVAPCIHAGTQDLQRVQCHLSWACREVDAGLHLDGADLDGADAEDTSGPLSATLAVQVWPKPVFRMPRSAFADLTGLPGRSRACNASDESEDEVSMAGPHLARA